MTATGTEEHDIKTMKLYSHVERIDNELRQRGLEDGSYIDPEELSDVDSMHYEGNDAIAAAIDICGVDSSSKVLDIGSGFGGPARVFSKETKCSVVALELQEDVHKKAAELTKRCKLEQLVTHQHGNILDFNLDKLGDGVESFDAVTSWLVFLHIPDKTALLKNCFKMLKDGRTLFTDDFYMRGAFSDAEKMSLSNDVYCSNLPTKDDYIRELQAAGFSEIHFIDKTADWTAFVNDRLQGFISKKEKFVQIHGEPTFEKLLHFYGAVAKLFNGGNLGGVRLIAKKK